MYTTKKNSSGTLRHLLYVIYIIISTHMYSLTYLLTCPKKSSGMYIYIYGTYIYSDMWHTSHAIPMLFFPGFFHMVPLVPPAILAHMAPAGFTATEMPGNWFSLSKSKSRLAMKIDWVGGALCQPSYGPSYVINVYKSIHSHINVYLILHSHHKSI
jgi:hypothetical protein